MEHPLVDSEILHSDEGGDVEWWLESRNKLFVFVIVGLLIPISTIACTCVFGSIAFAIHCIISIITHTCRSLLISTRRQWNTSTYKSRGIYEEKF